MLYEIHMLKNYPATNLNRDETGAPKTCEFGGAVRGRISSQCLKRTWRTSELFKELVGQENLGIRTRTLPELVAAKLLERGNDPELVQEIKGKVSGIANKDGAENKDPSKTAQIAFYSNQDIEAVTNCVEQYILKNPSVKDIKKIKAKDILADIKDANVRPITLDIALFGRMVTSNAFRDVEASMQVAHAVSTNRIVLESDYYTAMDDMLDGQTMENSGAANIGDVDYNSSCYYLYASVDSDALVKNLEYSEDAEDIVKKAIPAIIRTMALTNPSGKQNSFAGNVLPSAVLVECKEKKIPVSMVNAFAEPVSNRELVKDSIDRLAKECNMLNRNYGIPVEKRVWFCVDKYEIDAPEESVKCATFNDLVNEVAKTLE